MSELSEMSRPDDLLCVGADAVTWLAEKMQLQVREHATKILKRILDNQIIISVQSPEDGFVDSAAALYKFAE